ncbi:MAG: hypothetical protein ACTS4X_01125 [Candidatus Hodgkinia cicadicola]
MWRDLILHLKQHSVAEVKLIIEKVDQRKHENHLIGKRLIVPNIN